MIQIQYPTIDIGPFDFGTSTRRGIKSPKKWPKWLPTLFPNLFYHPFAGRHYDFWNHIDSIKPGIKPQAFFAIWARGGAKTTNAEAAAVFVGAKNKRKFCLYTRSTQIKANESVQNIAAMLESKRFAKYYPQMAERKLGKYNNSKGWRVDTLRCGNGFNIVALGYDAAVRGVKIEEFRPDLIIIDDIDDKEDSVETIEKKIRTLTHDILPAGSTDVAVIGVQNLVHPRSIFSKIANNEADFLYDRIVSGPYPAVIDLEYEAKPDGKGYHITGGTPTWAGQNLETCEAQINEWGLIAFLAESQHEVDDPLGGMYDHITFRYCEQSEVPDLKKIVVYVDPAITDTDQSDSQGIHADGIAADGLTIYRLYSWEQRTSPEKAIKRALIKALELGADVIGFETDQGGELWQTDYNHVCDKVVRMVLGHDEFDKPDELDAILKSIILGKMEGQVIEDKEGFIRSLFPSFDSVKAGTIGSKIHRGNMQVLQYEQGVFIHVKGTHQVLEKALRRFPKTKPFDLHDAAFWSQYALVGKWRRMGKFIKV